MICIKLKSNLRFPTTRINGNHSLSFLKKINYLRPAHRFVSNSTKSTSEEALKELSNLLKDIKDSPPKSDAETIQIPKKAAFADKSDDPNALLNLKYLPFYPKKIRQWVLDAKAPKGRFNNKGVWETVSDAGDSGVSKIVAQAVARRALKEDNPSGASTLPEDLQGAYRFGVTQEQIKDSHPKIKELLSFKHANKHEINQFRIARAISRFGKENGDTGSAQVQGIQNSNYYHSPSKVACMTERLNYLTEHMRKHPKDKHTQYRINLLISNRRAMMKYLKRKNVAAYYHVLKELGVKDMIP